MKNFNLWSQYKLWEVSVKIELEFNWGVRELESEYSIAVNQKVMVQKTSIRHRNERQCCMDPVKEEEAAPG